MQDANASHLSVVPIGHTVRPYGLPKPLERSTVHWCTRSEDFWYSVGHLVEPAGLGEACARTVLEHCIALHRADTVPTDAGVLSSMVMLRDRGRLTQEVMEDTVDYLDLIEGSAMAEEATLQAIAPVLRRRKESEVVDALIKAHAAHQPLDDLVDALQTVQLIGTTDAHPGMFLDQDVFARIDRLRHVERMSLGMKELDIAVEGGLGRSQLVVFMGKAGDGKSMALINLAAKAICSGMNVAMASLELEEEVWTARLLANLTGVPTNDILKGSWRDASQRLRELQEGVGLGRFAVKWFPPRSTKWSEVKAWYARVREEMGGLDLFGSDYADKILSDGRHDGTYGAMGEVYEEHRLAAVEWGCWAATASQKKSGVKGKADVDDASDSANKGRVTDMMIDLEALEDGNEMIARVIKNRHGPSRMEIGPFVTDWARARISASDVHAGSHAIQAAQPDFGAGW
ncbi:MAG: hypothetical protein COA94_06070 [Rickettsiales bacterium]|nr:MAG: hypothetical protein COA94_06070 [Rickettsiales bacterium]